MQVEQTIVMTADDADEWTRLVTHADYMVDVMRADGLTVTRVDEAGERRSTVTLSGQVEVVPPPA